MVENTGNNYRTIQAISAGFIIIAVAVAILVWGLTDLGLGSVVGVFLLIMGLAIAAMSMAFSGAPDKFGPSEKVYRLVAGILLVNVGLVAILADNGVDWYIYVAVLIIGVAVLGMVTALSNNKNTKY